MRYLVRPTAWYPSAALEVLSSVRRCCVGVSVGQPAFRGHHLMALMSWLDMHVDTALILVGDQLLRHTIRIATGCNEEEAVALALQQGRAQSQSITAAATACPRLRVELMPISSIIGTHAFNVHHRWVLDLESTSQKFADSLRSTARAYLQTYTSQGRRTGVDHKSAISLCTDYLREELAAFSVIHEWGWLIDVYPGPELPVLLDIARGEYAGTPAFLKSRISISLEHVRLTVMPRTEDTCGSLQPAR